jgi:hypothetical protein
VRIVLGIVILFFLALWLWAVVDVFRRTDLSTGGKAAWVIVMLLIPFIGLLVYVMMRPADSVARA